jgi:hypothetical protein
MFNRRIALAFVLVALAAASTVPSSQAVTGTVKLNTITFGAPVRLPGVVLLPGRYAFESGALGMHPGIVRVTSANRRTLYYQGFTQVVQRPASMQADAVLSFEETPVGAPKPIAAWFPLGSKLGHEFIYR